MGCEHAYEALAEYFEDNIGVIPRKVKEVLDESASDIRALNVSEETVREWQENAIDRERTRWTGLFRELRSRKDEFIRTCRESAQSIGDTLEVFEHVGPPFAPPATRGQVMGECLGFLKPWTQLLMELSKSETIDPELRQMARSGMAPDVLASVVGIVLSDCVERQLPGTRVGEVDVRFHPPRGREE